MVVYISVFIYCISYFDVNSHHFQKNENIKKVTPTLQYLQIFTDIFLPWIVYFSIVTVLSLN